MVLRCKVFRSTSDLNFDNQIEVWRYLPLIKKHKLCSLLPKDKKAQEPGRTRSVLVMYAFNNKYGLWLSNGKEAALRIVHADCRKWPVDESSLRHSEGQSAFPSSHSITVPHQNWLPFQHKWLIHHIWCNSSYHRSLRQQKCRIKELYIKKQSLCQFAKFPGKQKDYSDSVFNPKVFPPCPTR